MSENNKEEPSQKKSKKIELNKATFKKVLDILPKLLKEELFYIEMFADGFKLGMKKDKIEEEFPQIPADDLSQVINFTAQIVHYLSCHELDTLYQSFNKDKRKKAKDIVDLVSSHPSFPLLAFRFLRRANYSFGDIESNIRSIELHYSSKSIISKYFDIHIPFIDKESKETNIRLELDKFELEQLIASLTQLLKEK